MKPVSVSFIVPAYNEESVIGATLQEIAKYIAQHRARLGRCEVVVVAAGTDKTPQIAATFIKKFDELQILTPTSKVGKGRDVRLGMQAARGDVQIFMDADLSTPLHHILPMVAALRAGNDVVVGARRLSKIHGGLVRSMLSVASNLAIRTILLPRYKDTQCGFKGFTKHASQVLFKNQEIKAWGFDLEILQYAKEAKLKVEQLPINDWHEARGEDLRGERLGSAAMTTLKDLTYLRLAAWARSIKRHWFIWIMLAMGATFALAMWLGSKQSVWFDEAYSITLIQQSYDKLISLTAVDVHPPLYYLLLKGWSEIFGMGDVALRSFSAACAALSVGLGLALVRRFFGMRALVLTTPLVVLAPYVLRYAFEIRMYVLASLICVAGTYILIRAVQATNKKIWWWIAYSAVVALGLYTLYYTAFIWAAHFVWLLYMQFSDRAAAPKTTTPLFKQPWILAYIGSVVLYIPWIPTFLEQFRNPALSGIAQRVGLQQLTDIFSFMFVYQPNWSLKTLGYVIVFGTVIGMTYVVGRAIRRAGVLRPYLILLLLCFVVPIIIMTLGSLPPLRPMFVVRYTAHFIIFGSLLFGASLVVAFRDRIRYAIIGAAAVTAVLIYGVCNLNQSGNFVYEMLTRPHAKQVSQAIGTCAPGSIILTGSPLLYFEFKYYLPNCDIYFYSSHEIGSGGGYATIYQSPKQYRKGAPIAAPTVYYLYAGDQPIALPSSLKQTSAQSFEKYHLDIYRSQN